MDKLPVELHGAIASHLEHADYARYRLINKRCADVGLSYLFSTFTCGPSRTEFDRLDKSFQRMKSIIDNEDPKYKRYLTGLHYSAGLQPLDRPDYQIHDANRDDPALRDIFEEFVAAGCSITTLRTTSLSCDFFWPEVCTPSFMQACSNLTTLSLGMECTNEWNGSRDHPHCNEILFGATFRVFLEGLKHLTSLSLSLSYFHIPGTNPPMFPNIMNWGSAWPSLRTLKVERMGASSEEVVWFLESALNLEEFIISHFVLYPNGGVESDCESIQKENARKGWHCILQQFPACPKLAHATIQTVGLGAPGPLEMVVSGNGRSMVVMTDGDEFLSDSSDAAFGGNSLGRLFCD